MLDFLIYLAMVILAIAGIAEFFEGNHFAIVWCGFAILALKCVLKIRDIMFINREMKKERVKNIRIVEDKRKDNDQ